MCRRLLRIGFVALMVAGRSFGQMTESPTPAGVGDWLVQADVVGVAWDRHTLERDGLRFCDVGAATTIVSTGVAQRWDVQFAFDGWVESTATGPSGTERVSGWGDAWLRAKWNFAGDEGEGSAWAVLPYVKVPLANVKIGNGKWELGSALVFGRPLPGGAWLEAMASIDWLSDGAGGREFAFFSSVVVGLDSGWYGELAIEHDRCAPDALPVTAGLGYAFQARDNLSLDLEVLTGLNREAGDVAVVARIVWEFGARVAEPSVDLSARQ